MWSVLTVTLVTTSLLLILQCKPISFEMWESDFFFDRELVEIEIKNVIHKAWGLGLPVLCIVSYFLFTNSFSHSHTAWGFIIFAE